jgi:porin
VVATALTHDAARSRVAACVLVATGVLATPCALADAGAADADAEPAIALDVVYTGDAWRNTRGGLARGGTYLDNLDVMLALDGERLWGAPGLHVFVYGLYNNANTFSDRFVGDAKVVSNIDTARAVRLYEAWVEQSFGERAGSSLKVGLYDVNSEFDTTEARGVFINSAYGIGLDFAQSGENGPSIFPSTSFGARLAWAWSDRWLAKLAVLDGVPGDPAHPARTAVRLSSDDGALIVGELQMAAGRLLQLSLGHWRYTAEFEQLGSAGGGPARRRGNDGTYVTGEYEIAAGSGDGAGRLVAFGRAGVADARVNEFDRFLSAGLVYGGALRDDDQVGLAVAAARAGRQFRSALSDQGIDSDSHEYNVELTWRVPVTDWLVLQPDVQFVVNPSVDPDVRDALVVGVRFEVSFSRRR